jgi:hypothetical protein
MVMTWWRDRGEARLAERVLCVGGCGPGCRGAHTIVYSSGDGGLHVRPGVHDPKPPKLAEALALLYPRSDGGPPPECWPTPPEFNGPLQRARGSVLAQRLERGQAVELARQLAPGAPSARRFACAFCRMAFDDTELVMFEQTPGRGPGKPPTVRTVHNECCSLLAGGRYEQRCCVGCARPIMVVVGSQRTACSAKCTRRQWVRQRAATGG